MSFLQPDSASAIFQSFLHRFMIRAVEPPARAKAAQIIRAASTPFPGNKIPLSRISPVARSIINWGYWATPTNAALPPNQNFSRTRRWGGINNQYTGRVDFNLSDKQRMFGRYTQWNSDNIAPTPFNNGLISGDPTSPEHFITRQIVFGDTYVFTPSLWEIYGSLICDGITHAYQEPWGTTRAI